MGAGGTLTGMKFKLTKPAPDPVATSNPAPQSHGGLGLVNLRRLSMAVLERAPYNPRTISTKAKQGLAASIRTFGLVEPIIWNERTGYIVGGHQRYNELLEAGVTETDVIVVSLDPTMETALNLTLNNSHIQGDWIEQQREELLSQLANEDAALTAALHLDLLKLPEWEPLPDVLKPTDEDAKPEKITIKVMDPALVDEVLGEVKRLLESHWDKSQVSL